MKRQAQAILRAAVLAMLATANGAWAADAAPPALSPADRLNQEQLDRLRGQGSGGGVADRILGPPLLRQTAPSGRSAP